MNMYRLVHDDDVIDHMINNVIVDYIVSLRSHPLLLNNKLKIIMMGTFVDVQVTCLFIVSVLLRSCDHCFLTSFICCMFY